MIMKEHFGIMMMNHQYLVKIQIFKKKLLIFKIYLENLNEKFKFRFVEISISLLKFKLINLNKETTNNCKDYRIITNNYKIIIK